MDQLSSNYTICTGDTFYGKWIAVVIGGSPVDLSSGWQIRAQVRDRSSDVKMFDLGVQLGTAPLTVGGNSVTAAVVRIHIPAAASESVGPFVGVWDMEISHPTFDDGVLYRRTVDGGLIRSRRDVTR